MALAIGGDCTELIGWQCENTCKLSFHCPVIIEMDTSMCLWYKEREKGCRKNTPMGSVRFN